MPLTSELPGLCKQMSCCNQHASRNNSHVALYFTPAWKSELKPASEFWPLLQATLPPGKLRGTCLLPTVFNLV